jgi:hypothetical protein
VFSFENARAGALVADGCGTGWQPENRHSRGLVWLAESGNTRWRPARGIRKQQAPRLEFTGMAPDESP